MKTLALAAVISLPFLAGAASAADVILPGPVGSVVPAACLAEAEEAGLSAAQFDYLEAVVFDGRELRPREVRKASGLTLREAARVRAFVAANPIVCVLAD